MKYIKGEWRTIITVEDAEALEASIAELKTYTMDGPRPEAIDLTRQSVFTRKYRIYLYPGTYDVIKKGSDWEYMLLPVNYYNAQIRFTYDYRYDQLPQCNIIVKEIALQYLQQYLWHCNHKHEIETRILPQTVDPVVRCPKCGNNMRCDRKPLMPKLRSTLQTMYAHYCALLEQSGTVPSMQKADAKPIG